MTKGFQLGVKAVATLTVVTTVLSLSGFVALAPYVANAAVPSDYGLKEGNTISAAGSNDPDIYIVNDWGYKRLFLNPVIFNFYGHLGGFPSVKNVTPTVRDAFPTSGLFRNCETNDQKVYGVETTGEDVGTLHWVNVSGSDAVAQDANFFKKVFCVNNNEYNWYPKSSTAYTALSQIPVYTRVPGQTQTGPISVSLAADNPASGTLVKNQAIADLAHFQFSGNSTVTSLKLKRLGVSADTDLTNVYLYDGVQRLTDSAAVTNGEITFNDTAGIFTVSGSRVISVRADLHATNTGQTIGVQLTSVNGNAVNVSGNLFTVANATLATVTLTDNTDPALNATLDPANDVTVWRQTITAGERYVWLNSLQLRVIGSVLPGDLQNFRLYLAGAQIGSAVAQPGTNGYITFSFGSPVKIDTGSRELKVLVDVINGSGRNFTVSFRQASDLYVVDSQYNQPVKVTSVGTFPTDGGQQTIAAGNLTITRKTDSPSGDVIKDASGATLARFEFKATGEKMKVENLRVTFQASEAALSALRNGALFADGVQIGSTLTLWEDSVTSSNSLGVGYTEFSLGSSLIVVPGTPRIVEIRADLYDNNGTNNVSANDTITAQFAAGSSNVQRLTSLDFVSRPNATTADGNQLTVKTGTFTAAKYSGFANQSVVSPSNNDKIGHFTLTAASAEDINVNTINLDSDSISGTFLATDLTDMYIKVLNDSGSVIYTSPVKSTVSATASNSYSVNFTLPKSKTYQVEVWANVNSGEIATHALRLNVDAAGINVGSSATATATEADGQTITVQTGSLTKANGSLQAARLANGGTTANAYAFTLQPAYDNFTLDEVYVDIPANSVASVSGAVSQLVLKDVNGSPLGYATINPTTGSASFTGLNYSLLQSGGTKTFKVDVQLANVGPGANDTYGNVVIRLDGLKYRDGSGIVTTQNGYAPTSFGGNSVIDVAGYPVFENQALGSTQLTTGSKDIFQTKVSSVGTGVTMKRLVFSVGRTSGPTIGTAGANNLTNGTYKIFKDGTDVTSLGAVATASADLKTAGTTTGLVAFTWTNEEAADSAGHVYKLQVNVTATGSTPQSLNTQIANASTTIGVPEDAATQAPAAITGASVVWSDSSSVGHNMTTTDDWMNDYLIKTINVSQAVSM